METIINTNAIKEAILKTNLRELSSIIEEKCVGLCNKYSLTPLELVQSLDAFLIETSKDSLELDNLGKFEQTLKENKQQKIRQRNNYDVKIENKKRELSIVSPDIISSSKRNNTTTTTTTTTTTSTISSSYLSPRDSRSTSIKVESPGSDSQMSSQLSQGSPIGTGTGDFRNRDNIGQVVTKFNENLPQRRNFQPSSSGPLGRRCIIKLNDIIDFNNILVPYRFMFTPLVERATSLEKHLINLEQDMINSCNITQISSVGVPSQSTVWVCGRICKDAEEGKINSTSIILQGSSNMSSGRRVLLNLTEVSSYSLFPGQIVLIEGINPTGKEMYVKTIIEGIPKPLPQSNPEKLLEYHHSNHYQNGFGLNVLVASGPYTTSDNLLYEPFSQLLQHIINTKPDLVILIGPFVDTSQSLIQENDRTLYLYDEDDNLIYGSEHNSTNEMIFIEKIIRDGFKAYFNTDSNLPSNIILVPSLLDGHHEYVYPQPPFGNRENIKTNFFNETLGVLDIPYSNDKDALKRVYCAPNPCMFRCNEVLFGVTSIDPLFSLSADEVTLNSGHRMIRMAGHILQQQSFYPSFPVPNGISAPLDLRHAQHWEMNVYSPDVLIIPSKLTPLVSDVLGTLVINPGHIAKGTKGGTYANITINPINETTLQNSIHEKKNEIPHLVSSRSNVEIVRI